MIPTANETFDNFASFCPHCLLFVLSFDAFVLTILKATLSFDLIFGTLGPSLQLVTKL